MFECTLGILYMGPLESARMIRATIRPYTMPLWRETKKRSLDYVIMIRDNTEIIGLCDSGERSVLCHWTNPL